MRLSKYLISMGAAAFALTSCHFETSSGSTTYDSSAAGGGYASYAGVTGGDGADVYHTYYINEFDTQTPYTYDNDSAPARNCTVLNTIITDVKYLQKGKYWTGLAVTDSTANNYNGSSNYAGKLQTKTTDNTANGSIDGDGDGVGDYSLISGCDYNPVRICIEGEVENTSNVDSSWETYGATSRLVTLNGLKNVTIEGIGKNRGLLTHYGFAIKNCSNVIIRNIKFSAPYKDAIDIEGSSGVLIDHCSFSDWLDEDDTDGYASDGACDIGTGSTNVTVSYNHFIETNKNMLYSSGNYSTSDGDTDCKQTVSVMYNWFDGTHQRNPMMRFGTAHILNNYYDNVSSYGVDGRHAARLLVEGNYFLNTKTITETSFIAAEIPSFLGSKSDWGWEYGYPALIKLTDNYSNYNGEVVYPVHHGKNGTAGVVAVEVLKTSNPVYDSSGNLVARTESDDFAPTTLDGVTYSYSSSKHTGAQSWDYTPPYEYVSMKPTAVPAFVEANAGYILDISRPSDLKAAQLLVSHNSIYSSTYTSTLW